jgi:hypothetical protein
MMCLSHKKGATFSQMGMGLWQLKYYPLNHLRQFEVGCSSWAITWSCEPLVSCNSTIIISNKDDIEIYIMLYRVHLAWAGFKFTTLVVIGTDFIDSYNSNYHQAHHPFKMTAITNNIYIFKLPFFKSDNGRFVLHQNWLWQLKYYPLNHLRQFEVGCSSWAYHQTYWHKGSLNKLIIVIITCHPYLK